MSHSAWQMLDFGHEDHKVMKSTLGLRPFEACFCGFEMHQAISQVYRSFHGVRIVHSAALPVGSLQLSDYSQS